MGMSDGNPVARDYGETRANGRSLESGRGWYYGAGASVALGALFLLRRLRDVLKSSDARTTRRGGGERPRRARRGHRPRSPGPYAFTRAARAAPKASRVSSSAAGDYASRQDRDDRHRRRVSAILSSFRGELRVAGLAAGRDKEEQPAAAHQGVRPMRS
jgi:hypothetical protein